MELLMAAKLCLNIWFLSEILIAWIWMADGAVPTDAAHGTVSADAAQEKYENSTCSDKCTCDDTHSIHLNETLKTLNCSFTNLREIPEGLAEDTEGVYLKGNSLLKVPLIIAKLRYLRELDLSMNKIKSFGRDKSFPNMTNLVYLNIEKNYISAIFHNSMKGMGRLEYLVLSNNKINCIEDKSFVDLLHLKTLDLQQNLLSSISREWFYGLKNLVVVNLAHNNIHSIPASAFKSMGSLLRLNLTGNKISSVDPRAFSGLLSLRVLKMDDNLLSRMPTAAFQSLPVLETLTVDKNPISKIKPLDFSHLSVRNISVSQMPELVIIDAKAFYNLPNISSIEIIDNEKLSYIDPLAFMNVDSLRSLHLHNNYLQGLQKEMQQFLPKGLQLSIFGNPLRCDCNIRWLIKLLNKGDTSSIKIMNSELLFCRTPVEMQDKFLGSLDSSKLSKVCLPEILNLTQSQFLESKIGERQVIECRALGSPIPQLHWILPDQSLVNSTLNEISRRFFPPGTLVYYHLEPADSGTYTCIAQNSVGISKSSITVRAIGIDIFMFPIRVSSTFVTLVWNGTDRHKYPAYKITYSEVSRNGSELTSKEIVAVGTSRRFTINHLHPKTDYHFCLGYEDGTGYWLEISCCYVSTPATDISIGGIYRVSLLTVIGLFGLVLAMTCMLMYLISSLMKNHRQRFYETPDKSTDSFSLPLIGLYRPLLLGS